MKLASPSRPTQSEAGESAGGRVHVLAQSGSIYIPIDVCHGAKALEPVILIDMFTPMREDLLKR